MFNAEEYYTSFINLDSRPDRLAKMTAELKRVGIEATRTKARLPSEFDIEAREYQVMKPRSVGAIGCYESQLDVMAAALFHGKHAIVLEDDLVFCSDIKKRLDLIQRFMDANEWDVVWLGGTYHKQPTWHKIVDGKHTHPDLQMCACKLNKDWERTADNRIVRTYGAFSTHAYIVNKDSIAKIIKLHRKYMYLSMGIDFTFILLQPYLKTFAFVPGCVKQYNNQSNIGTGITEFERFKALGPHWWADKM